MAKRRKKRRLGFPSETHHKMFDDANRRFRGDLIDVFSASKKGNCRRAILAHKNAAMSFGKMLAHATDRERTRKVERGFKSMRKASQHAFSACKITDED